MCVAVLLSATISHSPVSICTSFWRKIKKVETHRQLSEILLQQFHFAHLILNKFTPWNEQNRDEKVVNVFPLACVVCAYVCTPLSRNFIEAQAGRCVRFSNCYGILSFTSSESPESEHTERAKKVLEKLKQYTLKVNKTIYTTLRCCLLWINTSVNYLFISENGSANIHNSANTPNKIHTGEFEFISYPAHFTNRLLSNTRKLASFFTYLLLLFIIIRCFRLLLLWSYYSL